jgi:hypothetical protein
MPGRDLTVDGCRRRAGGTGAGAGGSQARIGRPENARNFLTRALAVCPAALAAAAAIAAPASAATLTVPPCVVEYGIPSFLNLTIAGAGFTPGGPVAIESTTASKPTPAALTSATADAAGNFVTKTPPLGFDRFDTTDQTYNLLAIDRTNPAITAAATLPQVRFGFDAKPDTGLPSRTVRYTARGFLPGKPVYAHFRFRGKTRRNVLIGVPAAPCGVVSRRMRLLPTKTRFGTWTVYMDHVKTYSPKTAKASPLLSAKGRLVIRRTL